MKIYIKSVKYINSEFDESGYVRDLSQNFPGSSYNPKRVLKTIWSAIQRFPNSTERVYIPKAFTARAGSDGVVVFYAGTLQELQQNICKIIKDMAKQDDVKLYPRIKNNAVTYHPVDINGDHTKDTITFNIERVNLKAAQKHKETYGVDTYIIRLEQS